MRTADVRVDHHSGTMQDNVVIDWLLDSDPSIRWQVKQDLLGAPADEVAEERSLVAREGWGARLLAHQGADGQWGTEGYEHLRDPAVLPSADDRRRLLEAHRITSEEAAEFLDTDLAGVARMETDPLDPDDELAARYLEIVRWAQRTLGTYNPKWVSTTYTLTLLRQLGVDPSDRVAERSVGLVAGNVKWDDGEGLLNDYFDGETEVCVNSMVLASGCYFGHQNDHLLDRLLSQRMDDGGWNCAIEYGSTRSSFHTTINVLESLLEYERANGPTPEVTAARESGEEYLLERGMMRSLSSGELINPAWTQFSFPTRWHYDVLRGLDYLRSTRAPDPRCSDAVELVAGKRTAVGIWILENTHPGFVYFGIDDGEGQPSRWNTLRALRVLDWYDGPTSGEGEQRGQGQHHESGPKSEDR